MTRSLHFSAGALGVASEIVLLIIAVSMILSPHHPDKEGSEITRTRKAARDLGRPPGR